MAIVLSLYPTSNNRFLKGVNLPLITCPDCEAKISDLADACIHCGRPLKKSKKVAAAKIKAEVMGNRIVVTADTERVSQLCVKALDNLINQPIAEKLMFIANGAKLELWATEYKSLWSQDRQFIYLQVSALGPEESLIQYFYVPGVTSEDWAFKQWNRFCEMLEDVVRKS